MTSINATIKHSSDLREIYFDIWIALKARTSLRSFYTAFICSGVIWPVAHCPSHSSRIWMMSVSCCLVKGHVYGMKQGLLSLLILFYIADETIPEDDRYWISFSYPQQMMKHCLVFFMSAFCIKGNFHQFLVALMKFVSVWLWMFFRFALGKGSSKPVHLSPEEHVPLALVCMNISKL